MNQTIDPSVNETVRSMTALLTEIACALVDSPEKVSVEAKGDGEGTVLRLRVAPTDVGKIIGKQGRTARSMRTILTAASMKLKHRFSLDILEEPTEAPDRRPLDH